MRILSRSLMGGAVCLFLAVIASHAAARPPNIILIMADDLGAEAMPSYGGTDYTTPHLDAMVETGMRFSFCFSQPLCTPSRVQIMTGKYNRRNYRKFGVLESGETTFAHALKKQGYATCVAGKWQLSGGGDAVTAFGFDAYRLWNMHAYDGGASGAGEPKNWKARYPGPVLYEDGAWKQYGPEEYGPDLCTEYIRGFIRENRETPFFVYYPMILTHDPFVPTPFSKNGKRKNAKKNFVDMVAYTDHLVGRIVAELEEQGLRENTLVLFTGDNGTHPSITSNTRDGAIRGGKGNTTNAGTHVPLIASWPGTMPGGAVCRDLVDFSDFFPTLLEAAGGDAAGYDLDGRSFLPRLKGQQGTPREWVYCHYRRGKGADGHVVREFIRDHRWKLYADGRFYDLDKDPLEKNPLSGNYSDSAPKKMWLKNALTEIQNGGGR